MSPQRPIVNEVTPHQPAALASAVDEYHQGEAFSFHMPGHKQRPDALHPDARRLFGDALITNDLSEMGGFDYLHAPDSSIAAAQERAAQVFGAARTWFLVNGSTGGNLAAVTALTGDGDDLVMLRASHRSVYGGAVLAGAQPRYVPMVHDQAEDGWFLGEASLLDDLQPGDATLLHITRPNYYGMAADLNPWVEAARRLDIALIVDEAHGSHFAFDDRLPTSGLAAGADITIQSTHKTLGGLTQASMLHVSERGLRWADRIGRSLQQTQSSSPSALLSISLDLAADHLRTDGRAKVQSAVDFGLSVAGSIQAPLRVVRSTAAQIDPTKVVIDVSGLGMTGFDASAWLRTNHRIWIELADQHRIVCSLTIGDSAESTQALISALDQLASTPQTGSAVQPSPAWVTPTAAMLPRRALQAQVEPVPIDRAINRVVAEYVIPYPPGIPLAVPGEVLTGEVLSTLAQYQAIGSRIVGPNDGSVASLLVVR
jgi:arginine decarboxylase